MADTVLKPLKWMTKSIDDMAVKIIQKIPDFADKVIDALIFASEKICQQGWIPQWVKNGVIKMTTSFTINISSIFTKAVIKAPDAIIEGASGAKVIADDIKFTDKFSKPGYGNQVVSRGWSNQKIADAINNPYKVVDSVNNFTGNPAKVYFINDTHYVVIDSVTNKVVQVSDLTKEYWKFTPGDFTK